MRRKILMSLYGIGLICILYYVRKFYTERAIYFDDYELIKFTAIMGFLLINLCIIVFYVHRIERLSRQNKELKNMISYLTTLSSEHYDSLCNWIKNNREISLDIFDEVKNEQKK